MQLGSWCLGWTTLSSGNSCRQLGTLQALHCQAGSFAVAATAAIASCHALNAIVMAASLSSIDVLVCGAAGYGGLCSLTDLTRCVLASDCLADCALLCTYLLKRFHCSTSDTPDLMSTVPRVAFCLGAGMHACQA
jgi:hypothetical protein